MQIRKANSFYLCPLHLDCELLSAVSFLSVPGLAAPPSLAPPLRLSSPQADVFGAEGAEVWVVPGNSLLPQSLMMRNRWNSSLRVWTCRVWGSGARRHRIPACPLFAPGCPAEAGRTTSSIGAARFSCGEAGPWGWCSGSNLAADGKRIHLGGRRN